MTVPDVPLLAWILSVVCMLRAEHVWAANVWIARSGERFMELEAEKRESNRMALLSAGHPATWRDVLLTPEQRWDLYVETGGGKLPWIFFGIRSHRLLVAARCARRAIRWLLTLIRLAWLNWFFPIWAGVVLILLLGHSNSMGLHTPVVIMAASLCANTLGTLVGASFSAITMGGLSRHHDSWKLQDTAKARAIAELGYSIAAGALFVLSCGLLVQALSAESGGAAGRPGFSADSWAASLNFVLQGSMSDALHLSSQWIDLLRLAAHLAIAGTGIAWLIAVASASRMWLSSDP